MEEFKAQNADLTWEEVDNDSSTILVAVDVWLSGYSTTAVASFNPKGELLYGGYELDAQTEDHQYYYSFKQWKKGLTKKYGQPDSDDAVWYVDSWKGFPNEWGYALSKGDVEFQAIWVLEDNTRILLIASGGNYKAETSLVYYSEEAVELLESKESGF